MVVTIFGIPRSGKSTLVKQLVDGLNNSAIALRKRNLIEKYAEMFFGKKDCDLSIEEMNGLVEVIEIEIRRYEREYEYVILDSHVGYLLRGRRWVENRPLKYHQIGDIFIYLETNPFIIFERMQKTQGIKDFYDYSVKEIELYQKIEVKRLRKILNTVNKTCIIFNKSKLYYQEISKFLKSCKKPSA